MVTNTIAMQVLAQETRALLTRLKLLQPFALNMPSVPAAGVSLGAQIAIEQYLVKGKSELKNLINRYLDWLYSQDGREASPEEMQRLFTFLRLKFNSITTQVDIFADALGQRSEHNTGVWLSGLDVVAADALKIPGHYYETPPVICYLDQGFGAAIRRARTRLPGGGENPVAIVRIPRERMIGSGIASSLVHEVGHQGSALLNLVNPFRLVLHDIQRTAGEKRTAWIFWERWISEILADFWSVAKLGITSTLGIMGVVSLPRPFVFHISLDDPHPFPWIRVRLSCAIGNALYPNEQWNILARLWESFYPLKGLSKEKQDLIAMLESTFQQFVSTLVNYRPELLRGKSLKEAMAVHERQPHILDAYHNTWRSSPAGLRSASPTLAFAVIGQAKANDKLSPEEESYTIAELLKYWALQNTLNLSMVCSALLKPRVNAMIA